MRLPKSWKDITIDQFIESRAILLREDLDLIDKHVQLICALTGQTEESIEAMTPKELTDAVKALNFLNDLDSINTKIPRVFQIGTKLFWTQTQATEITAGQWTDIAHILSKGDALMNCHEILAVICNPRVMGFVNRPYDGKTMQARAKLFHERMPMNIAYPIALFFCNLWKGFNPVIQSYYALRSAAMTM